MRTGILLIAAAMAVGCDDVRPPIAVQGSGVGGDTGVTEESAALHVRLGNEQIESAAELAEGIPDAERAVAYARRNARHAVPVRGEGRSIRVVDGPPRLENGEFYYVMFIPQTDLVSEGWRSLLMEQVDGLFMLVTETVILFHDFQYGRNTSALSAIHEFFHAWSWDRGRFDDSLLGTCRNEAETLRLESIVARRAGGEPFAEAVRDEQLRILAELRRMGRTLSDGEPYVGPEGLRIEGAEFLLGDEHPVDDPSNRRTIEFYVWKASYLQLIEEIADEGEADELLTDFACSLNEIVGIEN